MFSRLATLLPIAALVAVAAAAPNSSGGTTCSTSNQACCNTTQLQSGTTYTYSVLNILTGLLSGGGLTTGVTCTPVTILGLGGGGSCTQQTVCCDGNTSTSLINLSCNAINV